MLSISENVKTKTPQLSNGFISFVLFVAKRRKVVRRVASEEP